MLADWFQFSFNFSPRQFPNRLKIVLLAGLTFIALC